MSEDDERDGDEAEFENDLEATMISGIKATALATLGPVGLVLVSFFTDVKLNWAQAGGEKFVSPERLADEFIDARQARAVLDHLAAQHLVHGEAGIGMMGDAQIMSSMSYALSGTGQAVLKRVGQVEAKELDGKRNDDSAS